MAFDIYAIDTARERSQAINWKHDDSFACGRRHNVLPFRSTLGSAIIRMCDRMDDDNRNY